MGETSFGQKCQKTFFFKKILSPKQCSDSVSTQIVSVSAKMFQCQLNSTILAQYAIVLTHDSLVTTQNDLISAQSDLLA